MNLVKLILVTGFLSGTFFYQGLNANNAKSPFSYEIYNTLVPTLVQKPQFFTARDATKLAYYPFLVPKKKERAVVILYHGGGAYSTPAYQWVAEQLSKQELSSYCVDIRGHGNSGDPRGDADSIEAVLEDVHVVTSWVQYNHPKVPIYLVGHSSGAGLLANYHAQSRDFRVNGYIMLAPYLGPKSATARFEGAHPQSFVKKIRPWVFMLNALLPVKWFAHVDAVYFNYSEALIKDDPLYVTQYSYVMSCATTPYDIDKLLINWGKMPLWVFCGSKDEQFIPERVIAVCEPALQDSSHARIIPDAGHLSLLKQAPELIIECIKKSNPFNNSNYQN